MLICECIPHAGIVHAYLRAGSPSVVANLWDVTDKDIDRYCTSLLRRVLEEARQGRRVSLGREVATARDACRLPFLVGAAPVMYGLPVDVVMHVR
jgi:separase